MKKWIDIN